MTTHTDAKRNAAYTRASLRRKMEETVGQASVPLTFEADESDDGAQHEFHVPHPFYYDSATTKALSENESLEDGEVPEGWDEEFDGPYTDEAHRAKVLLGHQWHEFRVAGGEPNEITHVTILASRDARDNLADGTPTRR